MDELGRSRWNAGSHRLLVGASIVSRYSAYVSDQLVVQYENIGKPKKGETIFGQINSNSSFRLSLIQSLCLQSPLHRVLSVRSSRNSPK